MIIISCKKTSKQANNNLSYENTRDFVMKNLMIQNDKKYIQIYTHFVLPLDVLIKLVLEDVKDVYLQRNAYKKNILLHFFL